MKRYTITELAGEFNVTPRAIRFYEDRGLLSPSREGLGDGRRVYSARDRTRLRLTCRGKRLGFTLAQIRALLDVYDSPQDTVPQLHAFLRAIAAHRRILERQLVDLTDTLDDLAQYERECTGLLAQGVSRSSTDQEGFLTTDHG
jgi:DNA-binding transcriptional MerR regulator